MKITLTNFKRFGADSQTFEFAPLTYILGANSTGKSSLFQCLLAVRQSIEAGRWLELLPRGRHVDLGAFRNFVHEHDLEATIILELADERLGRIVFSWISDSDGNRGVLSRIEIEHTGFLLRLTPSRSLAESRGPLTDFEFSIDELKRTNGADPTSPAAPTGSDGAASEDLGTLASFLSLASSTTDENDDFRVLLKSQPRRLEPTFLFQADGGDVAMASKEMRELEDAIASERATEVEGRERRIEELSRQFGEVSKRLESARTARQAEFDRIFRTTEPELKKLFVALGVWLVALARVRYLGPLRHPGKRVTSLDGDVDTDVGSDGERLADVLVGSVQIRNRVNSALERMEVRHRLAYNPDLRAETASLGELLLVWPPRTGSDESFERQVHVGLPDVGMGIRQVLPVLAAFAGCVIRASDDTDVDPQIPEILLVEQPELHLHPRIQMTLANAIIEDLEVRDSAGPASAQRRFFVVLETHSEHMILRTKTLVRKKKIAPSSLSLLAVEPRGNVATCTRIQLTPYGDFRGVWPTGFFSERAIELTGDGDD